MIIKFDHISYIDYRKKKDDLLRLENIKFKELGLKNINIKNELMYEIQYDHDLYFFEGEIPIEYILYDTIYGKSSITLEGDTVYGSYSNKDNAISFLSGIFGENKVEVRNEIIYCNMKGVLDKKNYWLCLKFTEEETVTYLDKGGYGTIAIIMNTIFDKIPIDGICTKHETITVNNKNLDICFTMSKAVNVIFEIVKVNG